MKLKLNLSIVLVLLSLSLTTDCFSHFRPVRLRDYDSPQKPDKFLLYQNYPNPFNPVTTIAFSIPNYSWVKIRVFNETGQLISSVYYESLQSGTYEIDWDGNKYSSGMYVYNIESSNSSLSKKMILIK